MQGTTEIEPYGDNFLIVILCEDEILHTPEKPFCSVNTTCPCHEDPLLMAEVQTFVQEGLFTPEEATAFVAGKVI